jgi:hypothetical protein
LPGAIRRAAVTGPPTTFYQSADSKNLLTTDAEFLYWAEGDGIKRLRKSDPGGAPETVGRSGVFSVFISDGAIHGDDLFLFSFEEQIAVVPRAGGVLRLLVPGDNSKRWPIAYGIDDRYVYWIGKGGILWRVVR